MTTPTRAVLHAQLDHVRDNGILDMMLQSADAHGLIRPWVVAIGSRETNLQNILGDFQEGEHHGVGIMQRDIQHPEARVARDNGSWKTPAGTRALIDANCAELAAGIKQVLAAWSVSTIDDDVLQVVAAGYNCGIERALTSYDEGDADKRTTGHDYGKDVMARYAIFKELLG